MAQHFLESLLRGPDQPWALRNVDAGRLVADEVIAALDRTTRNRGLLGRESLPLGTVLVLAPCSGIHTWFMRFAIDVIFVARSGQVLRVRPGVKPWRLAFRLGAFAVIETAPGGCAGTLRGHRLALVPAARSTSS